MPGRHEPDESFVDKLEWQISSEVRRRNRAVDRVHPLWRLARVAAVVVVSMALGAVAMGASYQIEESWRQELLQADLEVRLELARRRLDLVAEEVAAIQRRADVGTASAQERAQGRMQIADAEAQVRLLELQIEEISTTGREPLGEVSSPVVRGRDFVTERLDVELDLAMQMLDLLAEEERRQRTRRDVGAISGLEYDAVELALAVRERRVDSLQRRRDIRRQFVAGEISGVEAELMVRIADAEGDHVVAQRRFALMQREMDQAQERVRIGVAPPITTAQYEVALAEAEAELRLNEVELDVLRRELDRQRQR